MKPLTKTKLNERLENNLKEKYWEQKCKKVEEKLRQATLQARKEVLEEVEKVIDNWDVEPCCHGIRQDELKRELNKMKEKE